MFTGKSIDERKILISRFFDCCQFFRPVLESHSKTNKIITAFTPFVSKQSKPTPTYSKVSFREPVQRCCLQEQFVCQYRYNFKEGYCKCHAKGIHVSCRNHKKEEIERNGGLLVFRLLIRLIIRLLTAVLQVCVVKTSNSTTFNIKKKKQSPYFVPNFSHFRTISK